MTCYRPLDGWKAADGSGRVVFRLSEAYPDRPVQVPCGQCSGCRLEKARQWGVRAMHEAKMSDASCFVTLTYSEDNLPYRRMLEIRHWQLFMKKLRFKYNDKKIRFLHCGEYSPEKKRPHYHAALFGIDFDDKKFFKMVNGHPLYTSEKLASIWGLGFCTLGQVTFQSARYVASYTLKKQTGARADGHYLRFDRETGEFYTVPSEYATMSRQPGLGSSWLDKYHQDVFPGDFLIVDGAKCSVPRFYFDRWVNKHGGDKAAVRIVREAASRRHRSDQTSRRLHDREVVQEERLKKLPRKLEE